MYETPRQKSLEELWLYWKVRHSVTTNHWEVNGSPSRVVVVLNCKASGHHEPFTFRIALRGRDAAAWETKTVLNEWMLCLLVSGGLQPLLCKALTEGKAWMERVFECPKFYMAYYALPCFVYFFFRSGWKLFYTLLRYLGVNVRNENYSLNALLQCHNVDLSATESCQYPSWQYFNLIHMKFGIKMHSQALCKSERFNLSVLTGYQTVPLAGYCGGVCLLNK